MKLMKWSIPQWLSYDNTDLIKFRSLTSDFAGTQFYGLRLSGGSTPTKYIKSTIAQWLMCDNTPV